MGLTKLAFPPKEFAYVEEALIYYLACLHVEKEELLAKYLIGSVISEHAKESGAWAELEKTEALQRALGAGAEVSPVELAMLKGIGQWHVRRLKDQLTELKKHSRPSISKALELGIELRAKAFNTALLGAVASREAFPY